MSQFEDVNPESVEEVNEIMEGFEEGLHEAGLHQLAVAMEKIREMAPSGDPEEAPDEPVIPFEEESREADVFSAGIVAGALMERREVLFEESEDDEHACAAQAVNKERVDGSR